MDPLTEMHLLLREHGWEPENNRSAYLWTRAGCPKQIQTFRVGNLTEWLAFPGGRLSQGVTSLRKRLKQLAK